MGIKVVIADNVGGYWLSEKAYKHLGLNWDEEIVAVMERSFPGIEKIVELRGYAYFDDRQNPKLIECVEKLGLDAGNYLVIVEVDDFRPWQIVRDDVGWETIQYLDDEM